MYPFWVSLVNDHHLFSLVAESVIVCNDSFSALHYFLTVIAQIYRCYTIWRRKRTIVFISAAVLVSSSGKYLLIMVQK